MNNIHNKFLINSNNNNLIIIMMVFQQIRVIVLALNSNKYHNKLINLRKLILNKEIW